MLSLPREYLVFSFSPNSLLLGVLNALQNGRLGAGWSGRVPGWLVSNLLSFVSQFFSFVSHFFSFVSQAVACGRVPGWLVSHLLSFVSHFFSFVSQCFSFVSQAGCLWSGSWLACLPLPFICLPVLFICLPGWVVVGFQAGLSPTSFHLSPDSFHLSPRLSACGRVPGWLVSHFLSFVSQFFSFVSQAGCLWSGSWLACLPLPFMCPPLFLICLPIPLICLSGWVLAVGFPAGLSPTSFHLSPSAFHLSPRLGASVRVPGWLVSHFLSFVSQFFSFVSQGGCLWSGSRLACLPLPFICPNSFHLSPRLGACGRVPSWLVSHFLSFVSQFFSFVSQAGCLWSGSWLASPTSFHVSPTFSHLSSNSSHLSPRLGACGRVPGWLVCNLLSFVSQFFSFVSQAGCLWSGSRLACLICLPLLFICLPGWVLAAGLFPAGLSPTCFHVSPTSFHLSPRLFLVVGFRARLSPTCFHVSPNSFHLFPRLGACGRVPGWLVSHFLSFVSHFFSFVSQAGCLWAGSWLARLQLPFICLPLLFIPQKVYC